MRIYEVTHNEISPFTYHAQPQHRFMFLTSLVRALQWFSQIVSLIFMEHYEYRISMFCMCKYKSVAVYCIIFRE